MFFKLESALNFQNTLVCRRGGQFHGFSTLTILKEKKKKTFQESKAGVRLSCSPKLFFVFSLTKDEKILGGTSQVRPLKIEPSKV